MRTRTATLRLRSDRHLEFIDITDRVGAEVTRAGVGEGIVNVQARHTTIAIVVNENEPNLLEDLAEAIERWAPRHTAYRHDHRGRGAAPPFGAAERVNGHSHARAVALGASVCLNVVAGQIDLGRWQRIFLVELDGAQERTVSVVVLGCALEPEGKLRY